MCSEAPSAPPIDSLAAVHHHQHLEAIHRQVQSAMGRCGPQGDLRICEARGAQGGSQGIGWASCEAASNALGNLKSVHAVMHQGDLFPETVHGPQAPAGPISLAECQEAFFARLFQEVLGFSGERAAKIALGMVWFLAKGMYCSGARYRF